MTNTPPATVEPPLDPGLIARASWHRRAGRWLAWMAVRGLAASMRVLPWRLGCAAGDAMGLAAWALGGMYRRRAQENLERAMGPELGGPAGVRPVVRRVYSGLGRAGAEMLMLSRRSRSRIQALVVNSDEAAARLARHVQPDRGCVVITGHIGNWELMGAWVALHFPLTVVAKRLYYERFEALVSSWRRDLGMSTVYNDESPRALLGALRQGQVVGILPDQNLSRMAGVFVPFFGRPAWTTTAPANIARKAKVPLLPILTLREGYRYRILVGDPIELSDTGGKARDLWNDTAAWSKALEDFIREHPDHWVWFHRRWRTTPEQKGLAVGPPAADGSQA